MLMMMYEIHVFQQHSLKLICKISLFIFSWSFAVHVRCEIMLWFYFQNNITKDIPQIFDAVFECTLEMINKDFEEFPEHRTNFFLLLQAVNTHCFQGMHMLFHYVYCFLRFPASHFANLLEVQKSYCSHHGRTRSRSTLLKFSRSLYLDNKWSESIHTWTIGTL